MKNLLSCIILFAALQQELTDSFDTPSTHTKIQPAGNIFIITLDGFRWQEIFSGADPTLINDTQFTPDTATMKAMYWSNDAESRRKKLLPFFWNVIAAKGQLFGNREYDNNVNTVNGYSISYPGYNEMFTGYADFRISNNHKIANPNINVLEWLNSKEAFKGKVAAFTSWDVFPYILNDERNGIVLNSGYARMNSDDNPTQVLINKVQEEAVFDKMETRHDELTYLTAYQYIQQHKPKVVYLGLGETDEAAHIGRYDLYLEKAEEADRMIAKLWRWVQTTEGYKDNTTFIITTDHGRGKKPARWRSHGQWVGGSSQTWLAVLGPTIRAIGEVKSNQQLQQQQLAQTIAAFVGETFVAEQPVASAISFQQ